MLASPTTLELIESAFEGRAHFCPNCRYRCLNWSTSSRHKDGCPQAYPAYPRLRG